MDRCFMGFRPFCVPILIFFHFLLLHFIEIIMSDRWVADGSLFFWILFPSVVILILQRRMHFKLLESRCGRGLKRFEVFWWILKSFAKLWSQHMLLWLSLPVLTLVCTTPNDTLSLPTTNRNQVLWSLLLFCSTVYLFRDLKLIFLLLCIASQFL